MDYETVIRQEIEALKEKVHELEKVQAVTGERVDTIFTALSDIRAGVEKVNESVEEIKSQPSKMFWTILGTFLAGALMAGIKLM